MSYIEWMMVSEVGLTISSSSRRDSGSGTTAFAPASPVAFRRECVTIAHSFAKPSTCAASFSRNYTGMNSGKYALTCPVALNMPSRTRWMFSHSA